ncbi:MAG TPA: hypothetical protein VMI75_29855 [Polyangiaceae bacterium]|nr:hypothetical protein [Polyangiaceae bacterium]
MNIGRVIGFVVTSTLVAGVALVADSVVAPRAAFAQTTTKTLMLSWGTGTGAGTSSATVNLVRLVGNGGSGYFGLSIGSASSVCNVRTASLDQALALQTRITASNTTRVECTDTASGSTKAVNLSWPLASTQGLLIDSSP